LGSDHKEDSVIDENSFANITDVSRCLQVFTKVYA
jgi:hypothetical protein